jgi:hypothetical protein
VVQGGRLVRRQTEASRSFAYVDVIEITGSGRGAGCRRSVTRVPKPGASGFSVRLPQGRAMQVESWRTVSVDCRIVEGSAVRD